MKRILVATDLSARSERALRRAAFLARAGDVDLTLVHVVDEDQPRQLVELEVRESGKLVREQIEIVSELQGVRCHPEVVVGNPFDGILRMAAAMPADLIVMGAHRKQLLRDVFVGTTIERVVRTGPFPVLMVNRQTDGPYRSVVAPVDMSEASAHALKTADALGFLDGVPVTVVHAFTAVAEGKMYIADASRERIAEYVADEQRRAEKEVSAFLGANGFPGRGWQHHVREGAAFEVISAAVETTGPDLVVIGTHGRSGIARVFVGSVTDSVLRALETDILAVPPTRPAPL